MTDFYDNGYTVVLDDIALYGRDEFGTNWLVPKPVDGWNSTANQEVSSEESPWRDGDYYYSTRLKSRSYGLTIKMQNDDVFRLRHSLRKLKKRFGKRDLKLEVNERGFRSYALVVFSGELTVTEYYGGVFLCECVLYSPSPYKHGRSFTYLFKYTRPDKNNPLFPLTMPQQWFGGIESKDKIDIDNPTTESANPTIEISGLFSPGLTLKLRGATVTCNHNFLGKEKIIINTATGVISYVDANGVSVEDQSKATLDGGRFTLTPGGNVVYIKNGSYHGEILIEWEERLL